MCTKGCMRARGRRPMPTIRRGRASRASCTPTRTRRSSSPTATTSSINLLAHSFGARLQPGDEILLSILEHHSNLVPWQRLAERRGVVLRFLPMTPEGRLDLDRLDTELTERCRLVALTHCSNVTGALTDVARVVAAARAVGAKVMLDGAQRAPARAARRSQARRRLLCLFRSQDLWADRHRRVVGPPRTARGRCRRS